MLCNRALYCEEIGGLWRALARLVNFHLAKYCDEFSYSWNKRNWTDEQRTKEAIALSEGVRLMYKEPVRRTV